MPAVVDPTVLSHMTTQLVQTGNIAHSNFVTMQKVVDYDFLQGRAMVSLPESLGAREVGSKSVSAGPVSGT